MTGYSFRDFSVLVVEDGEYVRSLLGSALKSLGVGHVLLLEDGRAAIDHLKSTRPGPHAANPPVDIVISDWVMEPVDGLMLLRWLRRHKDSPNRFMPFLMLSAHLDRSRIRDAINNGANELMAKPFTADALHRALRKVIDRHRLFVRTKSYFGPDRRRKRVDFSGMEKREIEDPGGEGGKEAWSPDNPDIRFYRLPNVLKKKATAAFEDIGNDDATLARAEADFAKWAEDYTDWAVSQMAELNRNVHLAANALAAEDEAATTRALGIINAIAHELRGQGATFGYPLLTEFAKQLFALTRNASNVTEGRIELVRAHVDALSLVVRQRLNGDGGDAGRRIALWLEEAAKKATKPVD
jgi:CheY-like chemotaxis protein